MAGNIIQRVLAWEESGRSKAVKISFVAIEVTEEETPKLWIAMVLPSFSMDRKAGHLEKKYAILQSVGSTIPFDGGDKELGCVNLKWILLEKIDYTRKEAENR